MSKQDPSDSVAHLVGKVTPEARDVLAQVFIAAGINLSALDEDIERIVRSVAVSVARAHERPDEKELFSQIVKVADASRAEAQSLAARLSSLIDLDPELVDEVPPFVSAQRGRVGVHIENLKQLDVNLAEIADELRRREGRPFAPMAVFLVACEIWHARFKRVPPYSNSYDQTSPLYKAIVRIATDMDARAAPAFAFTAFKRARHRVAERVSKTNTEIA